MTPWRRHSYAKAMQIPPNGWPRHLRHQYHHHQQQQHDHQSHHHNHHHISFTTLLQGHFRADNCTRKSTTKKDSMDISVGSVNLHVFPSLCNCQALTGTRYPTRPGLFFSYPNRTRKFFQNFRVQGSSYICHY